MQTQHVHLSASPETAVTVGKRHGTPVVYVVDAEAMCQSGHVFYCSENGVWLVQAVPAEYLKRMEVQEDMCSDHITTKEKSALSRR